MRRVVRILVLTVAVLGVLLLFVLPARTLLAQRHSLAVTEKRISDLAGENSHLKAEAQQLQNTARIEQIAREDYGLVMPGQSAFAIIPAGSATTSSPGGSATTSAPGGSSASSPGGSTAASGR